MEAIKNILVEKIKDFTINSDKDGKVFLSDEDKEKFILSFYDKITKKIDNFKFDEFLEEFHNQKDIYDYEYEYLNFKYDKEKLLNGDILQLKYYMSKFYNINMKKFASENYMEKILTDNSSIYFFNNTELEEDELIFHFINNMIYKMEYQFIFF